MKYLVFGVIALIVFVFNTFKIDPYTNQINFYFFSEVAPKTIVKATSAYGYADSLIKGGFSFYCIKNAYDFIDVIYDKPSRYSAEYEAREKHQLNKIDKSCKIAKKINGVE